VTVCLFPHAPLSYINALHVTSVIDIFVVECVSINIKILNREEVRKQYAKAKVVVRRVAQTRQILNMNVTKYIVRTVHLEER
jgi:hypothetical protein